jgi:hypothetical protein
VLVCNSRDVGVGWPLDGGGPLDDETRYIVYK